MSYRCEHCGRREVSAIVVEGDPDDAAGAMRVCAPCGATLRGAGETVYSRADLRLLGDGQVIALLPLDAATARRIAVNVERVDGERRGRVHGFRASSGVWISDPNYDETGVLVVDPVIYYGVPFLQSWFVRGPRGRMPRYR